MNDRPVKPAAPERRYRANLQGEVDGAQLYRSLADAESDPKIAEVYRRLSAVEEAHGEFWARKLEALGKRMGPLRAGWRTRALGWLAHRFGPEFVLPVISGLERADVGSYDTQPDAVAGGLPQAERSHARILAAIAGGPTGGLPGSTLGRIEGRHRTGGNALRAAVLGANDGLVSNLSLVMGVAGATVDSHTLLITGLAGLVAGACSMAMGEWLSVNSARELYQQQIDTEAGELEQAPDEEKEEIILIYQAKGLDEKQARALADQLMANKDTALDTLVREELGIDPDELGGSAWVAAITSFFLFALGAIVPVSPFIFASGVPAVVASIVVSACALMLVGAAITVVTGSSVLRTGGRQVLLGLAAAAVTFGLGALVGRAVG